jgi:ATP-dependent DNA helicase RecQ
MQAANEAMGTVQEVLKSRFGHGQFRGGQEPIVHAVLDGRDVLAVMPTGSGKSLGFQLPAVMLPGTTIVVSPLISLMKDQVDELNRRGIPSGALHSMLPPGARIEAEQSVAAGRLHLLYVAPERFASDGFLRLLRTLRVARFVVDEAHCVSEWGHDFRPDYRRLRGAADQCRRSDGAPGRPPIAAFTATATPEAREDIVEMLGLREPRVLVSGFDRPNIFLRIERVADEEDKNERLPGLVRGRRAIVYAATRKTAEAAAEVLQQSGLKAAAYHAGLEDDQRTRVQDAFASGSMRVVCATNAFGMGIDRPDVDAVVHYAIPGSLEAYYQEIGRAGRDGRPATATLLWDFADVDVRTFLIDSPKRDPKGRRPPAAIDPEEARRRKELEHRKLQRMIEYADSTGCLRSTILQYFGEEGAHASCKACGNCAPDTLDAYEADLVRTLLSGIAQAGERYGSRRIVAMLTGENEGLPPSLTRLPASGALRHEPAQAVQGWVSAAISARLVRRSNDDYRTLALTDLGREVMRGKAVPMDRPTRFPFPRYRARRRRSGWFD